MTEGIRFYLYLEITTKAASDTGKAFVSLSEICLLLQDVICKSNSVTESFLCLYYAISALQKELLCIDGSML